MHDEINILLSSSRYIKFFVGSVSLSAIALVFALTTDNTTLWECFAVLMFLSHLALLCEFIDDRRKVVLPESEWSARLGARRESD